MKRVLETHVMKFDSLITAIEFETGFKYIKLEPDFETGNYAQSPMDPFGIKGLFENIDCLMDSSDIEPDDDITPASADTNYLEEERSED